MIITAKPPNFDAILAAFPDADKPGVIFAYGDDIYNPSGCHIGLPLLAHERTHCSRQIGRLGLPDQNEWWYRYLYEPEFRYQEEIYAHVAEYHEQAQHISDRNIRARLLDSTARRLIAPLYNYQPPRTLQQALRDLKREV